MCWGVFTPPLGLFLLLFYSSFLPPKWGPQGRYLSHLPFPPVVRSGCKDREVWSCQTQGTECNNGSISLRHFRFLRCPFLLQYFPAPWDDMECHYQWQVASFILDYIHVEEDSPHGREGAFPQTGPLAQCRHRRGPTGLLPPHYL